MIKENTDAALLLGLQVWNLQVGKEDVVDLFNKKHNIETPLKLKTPTIPSIYVEEILHKEKNSKFFGSAYPIQSEDEVKPL
jgi:hypothetical protein